MTSYYLWWFVLSLSSVIADSTLSSSVYVFVRYENVNWMCFLLLCVHATVLHNLQTSPVAEDYDPEKNGIKTNLVSIDL